MNCSYIEMRQQLIQLTVPQTTTIADDKAIKSTF